MANKLLTVFQNLDNAITGNWDMKNKPTPHVNSYDMSNTSYGNNVVYKAKDKEDYIKTKLELQQNAYLNSRWQKANVDLSVQAFSGLNNIKLMYRDADLMDSFPEIGAALDIVSEEATINSSKGSIINVYSKSERIKNVLEDLFTNRLDIQITAPMIVRAMCKYGNQFMLLNIDNKNGVCGWRQLPVFNVERLENGIENPYSAQGFINGKPSDNTDMSTKFVWSDEVNTQVPFRNWQIAHFRLLTNSLYLPYGVSFLNPARRHWRMLSLMEDMMLIYRLERSIERRVYKIFVGAIDDADVKAYVDDIANNFKRTPIVDPLTGQIDLRKNILPVRKDTPIPLLDGRTITIEELSKEFEEGKENYVYSIQDNTLQVVPGKVIWCGKNYTADKLVKVTLDDDTYTVMAAEHEVVMRDGSKKRADELKENDSVMPFYVKNEMMNKSYNTEYQTIYNPHSGKYEFTHRLVGKELKKQKGESVIHHINVRDINNRFNNSPTNLKWMTWTDHRILHNTFASEHQKEVVRKIVSDSWKTELRDIRQQKMNIHFDDFIWGEIEKAVVEEKVYNRDTLLKFINENLINHIISINCNRRLNRNGFISRQVLENRLNENGYKTITEYLKKVAEKHNSRKPSEVLTEHLKAFAREHNVAKYFKYGFTEEKKRLGIIKAKETLKKNIESGKVVIDFTKFNDKIWDELRSKIINSNIKTLNDTLNYINTELIDEFKALNPKRKQLTKKTFQNILKRNNFNGFTDYINSIKKNHKIKSIEIIDGDDVYCMTVVGLNNEEDRHNFAIRSFNDDGSWCENGIFVSNCTDSDIFIPTRDPNMATPIDTLPAAQNLTAMDDIKFVQNKVLTALRIPKTFLNFEDAAGDGKNLALMDVRFTRTINRIQQAFLMELTKVATIHLYILGFDDELTNFSLSMNNPSTQAEQLEIENIQKKIGAIRDAVSDPGNGIPIMSQSRALKEIMKWSDKDIQNNLEEIRLEKAIAAELEKTTQIIKKTGIFDIVDKMYGEPGAEYVEDQQQGQGEDPMGGGPMGGGGGGMPPDMGMDMGAEGELDELGAPGAEGEGDIAGTEGEVPITDGGADTSQQTPMESVKNKKPLLTENKKVDKFFLDRFSNRNETLFERVEILDKNLLINEEFDSLIKSLDDIKK